MEYPDRLKKLKMPTLKYRRLWGDMIETLSRVSMTMKSQKVHLTSTLTLELGAIVRKSRRNSAK